MSGAGVSLLIAGGVAGRLFEDGKEGDWARLGLFEVAGVTSWLF